MITPFLTTTERQAYEQVPQEISYQDLLTYFHFNDQDQELISLQRRPVNRLGFALQLALVRYMGFIPQQWMSQVPEAVIQFIREQLELVTVSVSHYGRREATRSDHLKTIMQYLGWRRWQPLDAPGLEQWLLDRALEHDRERLLLEMTCQKLQRECILRPAIMTLERIVVGVVLAADAETYRRLIPLLTQEVKDHLDSLLVVDPETRTSHHRWLARPATSNSPSAIKEAIHKLVFLKELSVADWNTDVLNTNRGKRLASLARKRTSQAIRRYAPKRRYPLLVAFLKESYLDITDAILTMFSDYWEGAVGRSRREMEAYQQQVTQAKDQTLETLGKAAMLILDEEHIGDSELRTYVYNHLSKNALLRAVETCQAILKPTRNSYLDFLENRYGVIKRFSPRLLAEMSFQYAYQKDDFADAMQLVTGLQTGRRRKLPPDAPVGFLTPTWKAFVHDEQKELRKSAYQISVLATLRDRLRSGDVFVTISRKFADLESYLIPVHPWGSLRTEVCQQLNMPEQATDRIDERVAELESYLPVLDELLQQGGEIRIEKGDLVVAPLEAEALPDMFQQLDKQISAMLPEVDLSEVLVEVDEWIDFSSYWPGQDGKPLDATYKPYLYAALLATACNIPLKNMARSASLSYQTLWWIAHHYLREDTIKQANNQLVNYHHQQWLTQYWGGGTLSSSDGQRFPVSGKIRNAKSIVRYFGFGQGVTFYTHTSDQYAQYGSKVIPTTERDATYVLDEILGNETDLEILEHTTDTAGYTDLLFALFDLLGLQFSPRIRDISDQKLCKIKDRALDYPELKFTGTINPAYLKRRWDDMLRLAGSLKRGYVTASLFISKLQSYPRQNNWTYVLQQYGQFIKTIFILRYLQSKPLRRKIHAQLNKGELLHALRSWLWFGGDGVIRRKQEEDQQEVVGSLNLLTNMVVLWNTIYQQKIIERVRKQGNSPTEEDIRHLSPARFEHINRLGRYSFQSTDELRNGKLRPLRKDKA